MCHIPQDWRTIPSIFLVGGFNLSSIPKNITETPRTCHYAMRGWSGCRKPGRPEITVKCLPRICWLTGPVVSWISPSCCGLSVCLPRNRIQPYVVIVLNPVVAHGAWGVSTWVCLKIGYHQNPTVFCVRFILFVSIESCVFGIPIFQKAAMVASTPPRPGAVDVAGLRVLRFEQQWYE